MLASQQQLMFLLVAYADTETLVLRATLATCKQPDLGNLQISAAADWCLKCSLCALAPHGSGLAFALKTICASCALAVQRC
jgi:hypothetical protein